MDRGGGGRGGRRSNSFAWINSDVWFLQVSASLCPSRGCAHSRSSINSLFIYRSTPGALNSQTRPRTGVSALAGQAGVHLGRQMTIHGPASSGNTVPAPRRTAEKGPFSHLRRASDTPQQRFSSFFFPPSTASLNLLGPPGSWAKPREGL